jgi:hypothetical protein
MLDNLCIEQIRASHFYIHSLVKDANSDREGGIICDATQLRGQDNDVIVI